MSSVSSVKIRDSDIYLRLQTRTHGWEHNQARILTDKERLTRISFLIRIRVTRVIRQNP